MNRNQPQKLRRLLILSRNERLYSTARLIEACKTANITVDVVDPTKCYLRVMPGLCELHRNGRALPKYDAVLPRIGVSITRYGLAVLRQLEMMGLWTPNPSGAISVTRDKMHCLQKISSFESIGMPITVFGDDPSNTADLLKMVGPVPHVIKLVEGTQGNGVVLTQTMSSSRSVVEAFRTLKANFLVQEFVAEAKGADIRCFVVGNEVVASMQRQAKDGEFRSNLHRGGSATPIVLTSHERAVAIKAAKVVGLGIAGVDLLRSDNGPMLLEVNSSPGLEGIEATTHIDVAGCIINYMMQEYETQQELST